MLSRCLVLSMGHLWCTGICSLPPWPCPLWASPPHSGLQAPRPASVGASLLAPAPALCCFCWLLGRLDPPARWGPARHSCLLSALLSSRHTASGWISHPTSDSEKGKGRLKGELTAAQCALLSQPEAWPDRHSPSLPAKAPASSPSRSALAASPSSGSLSIALALRMGAISYCFASVRRSVGGVVPRTASP